MAIGDRLIGEGHPPMIVAELSGNHGGTLEGALRLVRAAADAGADAIKLQTFTPETLTLDSHRPEFFIDDPGGPWHGRRLWELYREAHTPWEWHAALFDAARAAGLTCISTAFDTTAVDFLVDLDVDAIKIASFELIHLPLLAAAARSGRPLLVSTGMGTLAEIEVAVHTVRDAGADELVLLQCSSAYPAREEEMNVLAMPALAERFGTPVGLSDHTLAPFAAFAAVALGAAVVEKHVTLSRAAGGVDASFSIEPQELRALVEGCAHVWRSRGEARHGPRPSEAASLRERPSVHVVRAMSRGDLFTTETVRVVRPAGGLPPAEYASLLGRRCAQDIDAGVPLTRAMVQ